MYVHQDANGNYYQVGWDGPASPHLAVEQDNIQLSVDPKSIEDARRKVRAQYENKQKNEMLKKKKAFERFKNSQKKKSKIIAQLNDICAQIHRANELRQNYNLYEAHKRGWHDYENFSGVSGYGYTHDGVNPNKFPRVPKNPHSIQRLKKSIYNCPGMFTPQDFKRSIPVGPHYGVTSGDFGQNYEPKVPVYQSKSWLSPILQSIEKPDSKPSFESLKKPQPHGPFFDPKKQVVETEIDDKNGEVIEADVKEVISEPSNKKITGKQIATGAGLATLAALLFL